MTPGAPTQPVENGSAEEDFGEGDELETAVEEGGRYDDGSEEVRDPAE